MNSFKIWFVRSMRALILLILPFLAALIIQGAPRAYLLIRHGSADILSDYEADILKMFYIGLRFDLRTATYAYAFFLVLAAVLALRGGSFKIFQRAYPYIAAFSTLVFILSSVLTVFYFNTFNRPVDVFIFGLIDDDTMAILKTVWFEYPVVRIILAAAISAWGFYKLYKFWRDKIIASAFKAPSLPSAIIGTALLAGLILSGSRGSMGLFPLRQNNAQVSELTLLNSLTPNSFMAFDWALKHYKSYKKNLGLAEDWGDMDEILEEFFGEAKPSALSIFSFATRTIPPAAQEKPPHVVFLIMESMGTHLLNFDRVDRDLFGELRKHWEEDYLFRRFTAEGSGTLDSFTRLFLHSPSDSISQSPLQTFDFTSNMLKPYLNSGYKAVFVTSGSGSWRNLNNFLPKQGVSEFVEQNALQRLFPEAKTTAWGIADEYMFKYIENRLREAEKNGERLLVLALSTTFHPPYEYPKDFVPPAINMSEAEFKRLANLAASKKGIINVFNTLRYVNNALGTFLTNIKGGSLRGHTVVAVTGDHNIRGVGYPDPAEAVLSWAVPFYLYIPDEYREYAYFDPLTAASHKDIWATLYNITLKDTEYYSLGCDLLAEDKDKPFCFGYFPGTVFDSSGTYAYKSGEFREWTGETTLSAAMEMTDAEHKRFKRYQLFEKLLSWQLYKQINQ
ncbi:MAG: LTA synthase family protein [Deferribacteraceae bacterium]|jgi:phosphoglycerol transferase MdoB-like AlkP superfamily enzyme|nr:LTA synthase family protein [Deferribacteraceae bacterium]